MNQDFSFSQFLKKFPNDSMCLEEIKRIKYPNGIFCNRCNKITRHYKLKNRYAYACKYCRNQVYPLAGTIFEKTTTPLRTWFYAMFLMTQTRGVLNGVQLKNELGVTYKTAWRIYNALLTIYNKDGIDLASDSLAVDEFGNPSKQIVKKWVFFNKLEIKVVQKEQEDNSY